MGCLGLSFGLSAWGFWWGATCVEVSLKNEDDSVKALGLQVELDAVLASIEEDSVDEDHSLDFERSVTARAAEINQRMPQEDGEETCAVRAAKQKDEREPNAPSHSYQFHRCRTLRSNRQ